MFLSFFFDDQTSTTTKKKKDDHPSTTTGPEYNSAKELLGLFVLFVFKRAGIVAHVVLVVLSQVWNSGSVAVEGIQNWIFMIMMAQDSSTASDYIDRPDFCDHVRYERIPIY
jgi:hypothetical protein